MRTLEYMLENWEKMAVENPYQAQHEKYFRSDSVCKRGHPPIRMVIGGKCVICARNTANEFFKKKQELEAPKKQKKLEKELEEKERIEAYIKEREKALKLKNQCERLDQIKTGILFFVKGRCAHE